MNTSKFATSASRRFALVAGVALLALASCSEDKSISGASTSSSSSVAATSTTLDATTTTTDPAATTIDPTVTTVSEAPTTVPAPAPTAAPPAAPPADDYTPLGESRLVMLPEDDNVFNVGEFTCTGGISFDYGEVEQCVEQDDLIVISYRIPEGKRVVEGYVRVETFWVEAYRTIEEFDFELSAVDLYIDDFAGIGFPAAFIGYRIDGSGQYLDFDIVQLEATGLTFVVSAASTTATLLCRLGPRASLSRLCTPTAIRTAARPACCTKTLPT